MDLIRSNVSGEEIVIIGSVETDSRKENKAITTLSRRRSARKLNLLIVPPALGRMSGDVSLQLKSLLGMAR